MSKTTFLHIADLHMGMRLSRFDKAVADKLREARLQALAGALRAGRDRGAAFVVVAGDLFDDNTADLVLAQRVAGEFDAAGLPAYAIPGNHDPNRPGSIWQRRTRAGGWGGVLHPMLAREPVPVNEQVTLLPCPVERKTSTEDPTAWIAPPQEADDTIRIAVAHGSVMDRETLPPDDHPIPLDCAALCGADYVALGHWHTRRVFTDPAGAPRMAYPGTHEQMGFGSRSGFGTGWLAYAVDAERDDFASNARGSCLLVTINKHAGRSAVTLEPLGTGRFTWENRQRDISDDAALDAVIAELNSHADPEKTLLRLTLSGLASVQGMSRVQDTVPQILARFVFHSLDTRDLHIKPGAADIADAFPDGILRRIYDTLAPEDNAETQRVALAEQALTLLYRLCREAAP